MNKILEKETLNKTDIAEIRKHFEHCIDKGLTISEQEEKIILKLCKQAADMKMYKDNCENIANESISQINSLLDRNHVLKVEKAKLEREVNKLEAAIYRLKNPQIFKFAPPQQNDKKPKGEV